jgi:hypothetical protein
MKSILREVRVTSSAPLTKLSRACLAETKVEDIVDTEFLPDEVASASNFATSPV